MGVHIENNKLVTTAEPKTIHFNLSKNAVNNLKHEIDLFIKRKELLAEHTIKKRLDNYCPHISMEMIFMNREKVNSMKHTNLLLNYCRD